MVRGLRIAEDLEPLPLDAVTQAIAILARRGAGKTHTASVLVEEVVRAGLPVVVLDPTGAWWGLRTSVDGQKPGLPVYIFGGEHGDVPLEATAGKVIADVVIDHPHAYVIDLSGFESNAAQDRFVADFLERLYRGKATHREALLVVVDEADSFAPQRVMPGGQRLLGAMEAIVRRGRIRGLGVVLISQRAAVLNKNVLTQVEVLIALQTTSPQDRAAIDEWVKGHATADERSQVLDSLASLERGQAWIWSPAWLRILKRIRIRARTTFDSSATPEAGAIAVAPRAIAKVDLASLGERIAATVEQAKANDPAILRKRIVELERSMKDFQAAPMAAPVVERVEVPVLNGQVGELREILAGLQEFGRWMANGADKITLAAENIVAAIDRVTVTPRSAHPVRILDRSVALAEPTGAPQSMSSRSDVASHRPVPEVGSDAPYPAGRPLSVSGAPPSELGKAERAILAAVASYPIGLTREQLAFLADYHPRSKGFTNALGTLRSRGLITPGFPAEATTEGRDAAAGQVEVFDVGEQLADVWVSRFGRAEAAILRTVIELYPAPATREQLAAAAGYDHERSKGFTNALGRLRGLGLVDGLALHADFARLLGR